MPKLFLASSLNITLPLFIEKAQISNPENFKVAFIDIAAEPYKGKTDLFWVDNDHQAFLEKKFKLEHLDLNQYTGNFTEFDILHFCGGHTRYLLSKIHKLGHYDKLQDVINSDQAIFTGTSAGSMIVAPSLTGVGRLDDDID